MALPHIKNSKAGINREEIVAPNLFEVYFSVPAAIQAAIGSDDVNVLTEQVLSVSGMDTLTPTPEIQTQKFMGTTRSYIGNTPGETAHDIVMDLNLNLRNGTDNYIYKLFKAWNNLGWNPQTGERSLKNDYVADFLRVVQYNRAGDIFKDITYHDVMLKVVNGVGEFNYDTNEPAKLHIEFRSDWADDNDA